MQTNPSLKTIMEEAAGVMDRMVVHMVVVEAAAVAASVVSEAITGNRMDINALDFINSIYTIERQ